MIARKTRTPPEIQCDAPRGDVIKPVVNDEGAPIDWTDMVIEVTHRFEAPITDVWTLLSDVERRAGLGPEHIEARWLGPGPRVGARFTGKNRRGEDEWEVPCHFTESDPPHRLTWTVLEPENPSSLWSYTLTSDDHGTIVVQRFRHGPNYSFLRLWAEEQPDHAAAMVRERAQVLRADMQVTLANATKLSPPAGSMG
jgi:uncharacterized protein YndB with AHSA1/START domain